MTTTSSYPVITGSANVAEFQLYIVRSDTVAIVGAKIPVVGGRWSFSSSVKLSPAIYRVVIEAGGATAVGKLTVKAP